MVFLFGGVWGWFGFVGVDVDMMLVWIDKGFVVGKWFGESDVCLSDVCLSDVCSKSVLIIGVVYWCL